MRAWIALIKTARAYQPGACGNSRPGARRSSRRNPDATSIVHMVGSANGMRAVSIEHLARVIESSTQYRLIACSRREKVLGCLTKATPHALFARLAPSP